MPTVGDAFKFLSEEGPALFGAVGSMLYVGHRHDTHPWWHEDFAQKIGAGRIAVIDIDATNLGSANGITTELYLGDIRQDDAPQGFGLVFWDEGPEHMPREIALATICHLASRNSTVLVSCPWGFQRQGSDPTDIEFHHWGPEPENFTAIGMTTRTFGSHFGTDPNGHQTGHGNLLAWITQHPSSPPHP